MCKSSFQREKSYEEMCILYPFTLERLEEPVEIIYVDSGAKLHQ